MVAERCADSKRLQRRDLDRSQVPAAGAGNVYAVAICWARSGTREMAAFVGCEDAECVALVDPGGFKVGEKRSEGRVIVAKLLHIRSLAGTELRTRLLVGFEPR
jgi:hypothetical protein